MSQTLQDLAAQAKRRHDRQTLSLHVEASLRVGLALATLALLLTVGLLYVVDTPGGHLATWTLGWVFACAAVVAALSLGFRRGWHARRDARSVLTRLDRALGLKSQLAGGFALGDSPLAPLARQRAEVFAAEVDVERDLPAPRLDPTLLVLSASLLALALAMPGPPPPTAYPRPRSADPALALNGAERLSEAARVLRAAARDMSGEPQREASRRARSLERRAAALRLGARAGTASPRAVRSVLAKASGELSGSPQTAEELASAGTALSEASAGRDMGRALGDLDAEAFRQASAKARPSPPGSDLARAAEAAADALRSSPQLAQALRSLVRDQPSEGGTGPEAEALGRSASELIASARLERATASARGALERRTPEGDGGPGGGARITQKAQKRSGDGEPAKADEPASEGAGAPNAQRKAGGGGRRPGSPESGAPARGASGAVPVAGRGAGAPSRPGQGTRVAEVAGEVARLRGVLGRQGQATIVAVEELARGDMSEGSRRIVSDYGRVEEAALRRVGVPPEQRQLALDYLAAIARPPLEPAQEDEDR